MAQTDERGAAQGWTWTDGVGPGVPANLAAVAGVQVLIAAIALWLDGMGCTEPTLVIVMVLGVLVTAVLTNGLAYDVIATILTVLSFNYFLVQPRFTLRAWGPSYPEVFSAMVVVALLASYLVAQLRANARASTQAQLQAQREQLRADLLRSVSHDLRTPLTSIYGTADVLLEEGVDLPDATRRKMLADIRDDASWLSATVENLLAVTRLENAEVQLTITPELADDLVEDALRHARTGEGHRVEVQMSDQPLLVNVDARLVVQALVNLVNNACDHTPAPGVVSVRAEPRGNRVAFVVADDGPGIAPEDRARLFERFYTAGEGAADRRRGVGLGLSVCLAVARAHGGELTLEDVEPHGSAFTLLLPAQELPV